MISNDRPQPTDQVFLLLRPDSTTARALHFLAGDLREAFGLTGEPIAADRLHISLCSLGEHEAFSPAKFAALDLAVRGLTIRRFRAGFTWTESFQHPVSRPLVLRGDETLVGVAMLHEELTAALRRSGVVRRQRKFTPHMTLLYDRLNVGAQPIDEVDWLVRDIELVCSLHGRHRHVPLGRWPLRSRA